MDAIDALHQRVSTAKLTHPAPTDAQLNLMLKAATRAADHGNLRPWRFLVIKEKGLTQLGDLFATIALGKNSEISQPELDRLKSLPTRAPMILVTIAKCRENQKVPRIEQIISAGAATQNIINAAFALGLGAVWKTGEMAYDPDFKRAFGLTDNEQIVGFIYLGTAGSPPHQPQPINLADYFSFWPDNSLA
jgi:nitroreductase